MPLIYKTYNSSAEEYTSTTPTNESDLGLSIDSTISENWKLEWKLSFSYSTTSAAPIFGLSGINYSSSSGGYGEYQELYFDIDYGTGCTQSFDNINGWTGSYSIANYPSASNIFHIITITTAIEGYSSFNSNVQNYIYPTIAVANSGDICRILNGFGTSIYF
jgi:hypothetical protein